MSANVIAVMEALRRRENLSMAENAAIEAVVELVAADQEYDAALLALKDLNRKIAEQGWMDVEFDALRTAGMRLSRARQRRDDALANVGDIA